MGSEAKKKVKESFDSFLKNEIISQPPELLMHLFKTGYVESTGELKYKTPREAEDVFNEVYEFVKDDMQKRLHKLSREIQLKFQKENDNLWKLLNKKTQPILKNAQEKLKETFGEELQLPLPEIKNPIDNLVKPFPSEYIKQEKRIKLEEQSVKQRTWWHWLFLVPVEVKKIIEIKEEHWSINKEDLLAQISEEIKANLTKIEQDMNGFIDEDFQEKVNDYFKELNTFLERYKRSLEQARRDQQLEEGQKNDLLGKLKSLQTEAKKHIDSAETYQRYTNDLLKLSDS